MIDITPEDSVVPIYLVPPTKEEQAELDRLAAEAEAEETAKAKDIESARKKLKDLGLNDKEISALIGI